MLESNASRRQVFTLPLEIQLIVGDGKSEQQVMQVGQIQ